MMNFLRIIIRLLGIVYGAIHFTIGSSMLLMTMQSPESADLILLCLLSVTVIGTLSGYWVFRQRFSILRWVLISISFGIFLIVAGFGIFIPPTIL